MTQVQQKIVNYSLILLIAVHSALSVLAQNDPPYTSTLVGHSIKVDSSITVKDTVFFNPLLKPTILRTNSINNVISLRIDEYSNLVLPDSFRVEIKVKLVYVNKDNLSHTIKEQKLAIDYNKFKPYKSYDVYYMQNGYQVQVKVLSVTASYAPLNTILPALILDNKMLIDRDYVMNPVSGSQMDCSANAIKFREMNNEEIDNLIAEYGELKISWIPNTAVEKYDLEWTYIDKSALDYGNYSINGKLIPQLIFKNNATRITTAADTYMIPLLYDGEGSLFFRVRGVQEDLAGELITTLWSSDFINDGGLARHDFIGHERALNWQGTTTFAEQAKRKSVVQYFDGSLRNRQTVTRDNTTRTTVAAETLYDHQGRPVIQVLPAPTLSRLIGYAPNLNININGAEYDKGNYDTLINTSDYCETGAESMTADSGAARYYSPNNPRSTEGIHQFIPDAKGYAFTETQYTQDNTGRINKQGGVGQEFQLGRRDENGNTHETKYFYGTPEQTDLDALFGTEAGEASHYQKNMVRDANGQYSVSYVDMHGRTIATALAGESPVNIQRLNSYRDSIQSEQLLNLTNNIINGSSIQSSKTILVPMAGNHDFTYSMEAESLSLQDCEQRNICYDCLYDLTITITHDCNNQLLPGGSPIVIIKSNFSLFEIDTSCNIANPVEINYSAWLQPGSYNINKVLSISREGMQYYRDNVYLPHNTCKTYDDILNEQKEIVRNDISCDNIAETKYEYESYHNDMLMDLYPLIGQYADTASNSECFSIFDGFEGGERYRSVNLIYLDEEGKRDTVINSGGVPAHPNQLTKEEFITNFKSSWANELLEIHPEYALLIKYESFKASHQWDENFTKTETFAEAEAKGYLNPTGNIIRQPAASFAVVNRDSLYTNYAESSIAKQAMEDILFNFQNINGINISLWGFATALAKCPNADTLNRACVFEWNGKPFFETLCEGELDMAWKIFRTQYISKKQDWMLAYIRSAVGNPSINEPCTRNFTNANELLSLEGFGFTPQDEANQKESAIQLYADNCKSFASRWWQQLTNGCYSYTVQDSAIVIDYLLEVCKEGTNIDHPFGSSTVKPGSAYRFKSFEDVIKFYNDSTGRVTDINCNSYLIDKPQPYQQSVPLVSKQLFGKPQPCECEKINEYKNQFDANTAPYGSFSHFMQQKFNTRITQVALDSLINLCSVQFTCKYIPKPVSLPPVFQCLVEEPCVPCTRVTQLYDSFLVKFPNQVPAKIEAGEAKQKINQVFVSFMNQQLGFSKSHIEYLEFLDSCWAFNSKVTACDSMELLILQYQQQYINPGSGYVDLDMRTFAGNKTPAEGPKGVFDINGNIIGNTIDGTTQEINQSYAQVWNSCAINRSVGELSALPDGRFRLQLDSGYAAPCNGIIGQRFYQFEASVYDSITGGQVYTGEGSYIDFGDSTYSFIKGKVYADVVVNGENISTNPRNTIAEFNYCWRAGENAAYLANYSRFKSFRLTHKYIKQAATWKTYTVTVYHTDLKGFVGFIGGRRVVSDATTSPFKNLRGFIPQQTLALYYASTQDSTICRTREVRNFKQISTLESFEISNRGAAPFDVNLESFENNHKMKFLWWLPAINPPAIAGTPFHKSFPNLPANFPNIGNMWLNNIDSSVFGLPMIRQIDISYKFPSQLDSLLNQLARANTQLYANGRVSGTGGPTDASAAARQLLTSRGWGILGANSTTYAFYSTNYLNVVWDKDSLVRTNAFTEYYNSRKNTNYSFDQLQLLYKQKCGQSLDLCSLRVAAEPAPYILCGKAEAFDEPFVLKEDDPCADSTSIAIITATERHRTYKDSLTCSFEEAYQQKCLNAINLESFTVSHPVSEYHYTLYYYDLAGNLIKTIPPEGVHPNRDPEWLEQVGHARQNKKRQTPIHTLISVYRYNSLNQVVTQKSPDGGYSRFWYDRLGRMAVSQNAKQAVPLITQTKLGRLTINRTAWLFSYTLYDPLGRITQVGQKRQATVMTNTIARDTTQLKNWMNFSYLNAQGLQSLAEQVTSTVYDVADDAIQLPMPIRVNQKGYTLRNRVSYTRTHDYLLSVNNPTVAYSNSTTYSYDIHGNVDTLLQQYRSGLMAEHADNRFKVMAYKYDLVSGKVNQVHYQPGQPDQLYHRYDYDAENRITDVFTTGNKLLIGDVNLEEHDAHYDYYKHGPLAKTVLGHQQVQGIDYAYTLQGWLKGVNSDSLLDNDGKAGTPAAKDAYRFSLNYFNGDYQPISYSMANIFPGHSAYMGENAGDYKPLFNGNISSMVVGIPKLGGTKLYNYGYDQLNRLISMDAWKGYDAQTGSWAGLQKTEDYKERISYDANGNILSYLRNGLSSSPPTGGGAGGGLDMDDMLYGYNKDANGNIVNNRLRHIQDAVANANYTEDIDNQSDDNYSYDAIGNLIKDNAEKITDIQWSVYGKILKITKTATANADVNAISYTYDAAGNRISKKVEALNKQDKYTWYARDASGNTMAVYEYEGTNIKTNILYLKEQHLYGSSRLGVWNRNVNMDVPADKATVIPLLGPTFSGNFERGNKFFELSNHLSNVLVTVSDKKIGVDRDNDGDIDYYEADVVTANDYFPGGMLLPGRTFQIGTASYRFGFNSHEKSNEIAGKGNHTTAFFGEYDTRLGRRWNPDPKPSDGVSIFSVFLNNPIWRNDILLDTPTVKQAALMAENSYSKFDANNPVQAKLKEMGWNRVDKIKTNLFGKSNQEVSLDDLGASGYNMALYSRTLNGKTEWSLANAGTADLIDVGSDVKNLTGSSDQYAFSVRFAKSLQNGMGGQEMTYVGHSLGGGLAAANSLATGNAAITFNPAGVSWGTRMANNLPKDKGNGQIQSFVVGGEAIDRSQRWVGSKANGQITYFHPQLGKIDSGTALYLRCSTDVITSIQYHMMSTVMQSLDKAGIK